MAKWVMNDLILSDTFTFFSNANLDEEQYQKNLQFEAVVLPGALPLLYEGQDTPAVVTLSGTMISQTQYQTFVGFFARRHTLQLVDDRGYIRNIYITQLQGTRKPSAQHAWRIDWQITAYLIGAPTWPVATT